MKKKRQSEPYDDVDNDSTESCDDNQNKSTCKHIMKSIDLSKIKRTLKVGLNVSCTECSKILNSAGPSGDYEYDLSLWLCLQCGNQACGRAVQQHALKHFSKPHSDSHAIAINTTTWIIWCYMCDNEINPDSKKKLLEICEYIKKQKQTNTTKVSLKIEEAELNEKPTSPLSETSNNALSNLPRVRGLTNLGNTCFFNAVLQCLARTPFLLDVLKEMSVEGEKFRLPGGTFKYKDETEELPPIEGELAAWGNLTKALAETLEELQTSGGVVSPRNLFSQLKQKMRQFGGGDQEDSHELLRLLLEAVRTEDLRRYQNVILHELGLNRKVNPEIVATDSKQKIKFYGTQVCDMIFRPEQVFRGVLISSLQCQDCFNTSTRDEYFLDLSLPVMADKPQPPIMRKKTEHEDEKPLKYEMDKHKGKRTARKARLSKNNPNDSNEKIWERMMDNSDNDQSDADVEDNLEDISKNQTTPEEQTDYYSSYSTSNSIDKSPPSPSNEHTASNFGSLFLPDNLDSTNSQSDLVTNTKNLTDSLAKIENENLINAEKTDLEKEYVGEKSSAIIDTNVCNLESVVNRLTGGAENETDTKKEHNYLSPNSSHNSNDSSDLSSPDMPASSNRHDVSPDEGVSQMNDEQSKSPVMSEEKSVIPLSWPGDMTSSPTREASLNSPDSSLPSYANDYKPFLPPVRDSWKSTIGAQYQCNEGECSVQSCLNQFTAVELMTGNNKVSCANCTKRFNGKDGKNVYTNSTKQLLIGNPSAVLILHLKRFQVFRNTFRKLTKPVTFPLILDLAPFCSNKCKNLQSANQKKVVYSLYGVVEHSGTIHGGHYVAYVKVRPTLSKDDYRWRFVPRGTKSNPTPPTSPPVENIKFSTLENENPEPPPGKWYYVSDSSVSESSESQVLRAQAYLLFYERIL